MTTPTTNPVPSSSVVDLLFNAEKLDEVVNSGAPSYQDRFGQARLTAQGAIDSIKSINARGAWAAATVYAAKDVVQVSGTWYIAVTPHTSSAVFATDAGKWRVYQGVMAGDLASSSGASLMGFAQAGTGSVPRTMQDKGRELEVSVRDYGAVGNGVADDTASINAAITYVNTRGGGRVQFPQGTYRVKSSAMYKSGVELHGDGWGVVTLLWHPDTNIGGAILNTVNQPLNRAVFKGLSFARHASITASVTGILGGSTMALYNSAIARFEDLLFDGINYGIRGNAEPTGVGIFDCLIANCWFNQCFFGLWLFGSANRVEHCRWVGCDAGIAMDYLNAESFDGMTVTGGIHVNNTYDISILSASGIRPTKFIGVWHEQSSAGIINVANAGTRVMNLDFSGCMLSTASTISLFNVAKALGTVTLNGCTLISGGVGKSQSVIRPTSSGSRLIARGCQKYDATGVASLYSNHPVLEATKNNVAQSIPPNVTTQLTWASTPIDSVTGMDLPGGRYVVQDPGIYQVSACACFAPETTSTSQDTVSIYKNGAVYRSAILPSNSSANHTVEVNAPVTCVAGDVLEIRVLHANSSSINILGNNDLTRFCAHMVSER